MKGGILKSKSKQTGKSIEYPLDTTGMGRFCVISLSVHLKFNVISSYFKVTTNSNIKLVQEYQAKP
jgi:hypothetical protein